jgi:hypothetical protein
MNEMNSESKRRVQRPSRRSLAIRRSNKIAVPEYPKFLARLAGWRKMWSAGTGPKPHYRHD